VLLNEARDAGDERAESWVLWGEGRVVLHGPFSD
jgi:hypothetical protein